jgi:putative DNA primase/helicase
MLHEILEVLNKHPFKAIPMHAPTLAGCSCSRQGCKEAGKHPRIANWTDSGTSDHDEVKAWFEKWPHTNVGFVTGQTSQIVVVDIDADKGGFESLANLESLHGKLPRTLSVITGGGGRHFYYQYPPGTVIANSASKLGTGIDIRANGGCIVAPPSLHRSGNRYQWEDVNTPIQPLPGWIIKKLTRKDSPKTERGTGIIPEGQRNSILTSEAGRLRQKGAEYEEILSEIHKVNHELCKPPLDDEEVESIAKSVSRYEVQKLPEEIIKPTEFGYARQFVDFLGDIVLYQFNEGKYWFYNGKVWIEDKNMTNIRSEYADWTNALRTELESFPKKRKQLQQLESAAKMKSICSILTAVRKDLIVDFSLFDRDHHFLNLQNGTLNLDTCELLPHDRRHFITKILGFAYNPQATAPTWVDFLNTIFYGDVEMIAYLQQAVGYTLSGDQTLQCFFYLTGEGKNGKSTFIETLLFILGPYAIKNEIKTLEKKRGRDSIPNDLARFRGTRMVSFSEVSSDMVLDEARIKDFTGGDRISARFLYGETFEFEATHTIWIYGNHKPNVRGIDDGLWRRFKIIEISYQVPEELRDGELPKKLKAEAAGILNWALEGYHQYLANGRKIKDPDSVSKAVLTYRNDADQFQEFLNDCCKIDKRSTTFLSSIYNRYIDWAERNNQTPLTRKEISERLSSKSLNLKKSQSNGSVTYIGISLIPIDPIYYE